MVERDQFIVLTLSDQQSREEKARQETRENQNVAEIGKSQNRLNESPVDDDSEVASDPEITTDTAQFRHEATMVHTDEVPMTVLR